MATPEQIAKVDKVYDEAMKGRCQLDKFSDRCADDRGDAGR